MHKYVTDILRGLPKNPPVEVEFRFRVPVNHFAIAHAHWANASGPAKAHTHDEVLYSDWSDLRRVGDKWQQKRAVDFRRVNIAGMLRVKLCASVETDAAAPPEHELVDWRTRRRERWSYPMDLWTVDWTLTEEGGEIEIEFTGDVSQLCKDEELCGLRTPMTRCVACIAFLVDAGLNNCSATPGDTYVRAIRHGTTVGLGIHRYVKHAMQKMQPLSLAGLPTRRHIITALSLKYDGVRAVLVFKVVGGVPLCWMFDRRGLGWSIPCTRTPSGHMILDGELMPDGRFIAFDILDKPGERLRDMPFAQRIEILKGICMPTCLPFKIVRKKFYSTHNANSILEACEQTGIDGIIVHDLAKGIMDGPCMWKWKPEHTVDLRIGENNQLMARDYVFSAKIRGTIPPQGELWEFKFVAHNEIEAVRPRKDKENANPHKVCVEIQRAHDAALTVKDVIGMATG